MKNTIYTTIISVLLSSTAIAGSGPITSVKLSAGGVAEIARTASVDESGIVEIDVPLHQVDDLLKSLAVFSSKATVRDLALAGPQPIEETFERLPFSPSDLNSFSKILGAMKGSKVTLDAKTDIIYTIVGVQENAKGENAKLILLTSDSELTAVELLPTTKVRFVDGSAQKKIDDAVSLLASAATDNMRTIQIRLAKTKEKDVDISYVVAAPIWKPTYKLIVKEGGKARLQAWAVLENASGEDWDDVSITLSSGRPVTLKQRLHERVWKERDEVLAEAENSISAPNVRAFKMGMEGLEAATSLAAPAPTMAATDTSEAVDERLAMANFELPGKFSVRNGDTLSTPILDKEVEAEFVALIAPGQDRPKAALLVKNSTETTLPAGIMTIYDEKGGYVGDARFDDIAAGEIKSTVFGVDLKTNQTSKRQANEVVTEIKLVESRIEAKKISTITDTWTVTASEGRTIVVEDQVPPGYRIAPDQRLEETPFGIRAKAIASPNEPTVVTVKYEREERDEMIATNPDEHRIGLWIRGTSDEAVKEKLKDILSATAELGEATRQINQAADRYHEIEREQARLRDNISNIDDASLKRRWLDQMGTLEDELEELNHNKKAAEAKAEELRRKLGEKIKAF
jgi:hypothetical protein